MNFSGIIDGWSLEFTQQVWICAIWLYFIFWGRWTVYPWQLVLPALDPKSISKPESIATPADPIYEATPSMRLEWTYF